MQAPTVVSGIKPRHREGTATPAILDRLSRFATYAANAGLGGVTAPDTYSQIATPPVTDAVSIFTPGPIVDESEIFFR